MATREETGTAMQHLLDGFPKEVMPEETIEAYAEDLEDVPVELLMEAVRNIRRTSRFFPKIAEIRAECSRIHTEGSQSPVPRSYQRYLPEPRPEHVPIPEDTRLALERLKESCVIPIEPHLRDAGRLGELLGQARKVRQRIGALRPMEGNGDGI